VHPGVAPSWLIALPLPSKGVCVTLDVSSQGRLRVGHNYAKPSAGYQYSANLLQKVAYFIWIFQVFKKVLGMNSGDAVVREWKGFSQIEM
jgi:hypothetical protein